MKFKNMHTIHKLAMVGMATVTPMAMVAPVAMGPTTTTAAVALGHGGKAGKGGKGKKGKKHGGGATSVEVATAVSGTATSQLELSGQVIAAQTLAVVPTVSGRIAAMDVTAGQQVTVGQTIAQLADPTGQIQLASAEAALAQAQAKLATGAAGATPAAIAVAQADVAKAQAVLTGAEQLYNATVASSDQGKSTSLQVAQAQNAVDQAQAGLDLAEAQLAVVQQPPSQSTVSGLQAAVAQAQDQVSLVQADLGQDTITAPFAGTITVVTGVIGAIATPGSPVATLDSTQLTVQAPLSEADVGLVHTGQPATFTSPANGTQATAATVTNVSSNADPTSMSFTVTLSITGAPPSILSGESVTAEVTTQTVPSAVLVPAQSVVSINGTPQVFVVGTGNKAALVSVVPGITDGTTTAVTGLPAASEVVDIGQTYLASGDAVRVTGHVPVPSTVVGNTVGGLASVLPVTPPSPTAGKGGKGGKGG